MSGAPAQRLAVREDDESFILAVLLAMLAGWVDALGYLRFHGLFVSFMSGNSTQAAVAVARHDVATAVESVRAILVFLVGVVLGELIGPVGGRFGRPLVLGCEALLLWAAVLLPQAGEPVVTSLLGLAMGLQNASVHRAGGISVALTYVTGTLVHFGQRIAQALRGAALWSAVLPFLSLWIALVVGGLGGAMVTRASEAAALVTAASAATLLAIWALVETRQGRAP